METEILKLLNKKDYQPLTKDQIKKALGLNDAFKIDEILTKLEEEGKIYKIRGNCYSSTKRLGFIKAIISINPKGFGFALTDDHDDIYIEKKNLNGAIEKDIVLVQILTKERKAKSREGRVIKILKRSLTKVVGEYREKKNKGYLILDDKKINIEIIIPKHKSLDAVPGHKVLVNLEKELGQNKFTGEVIEILGHKNDPGVDILSIIYNYNFRETFPEEVHQSLKKIPNKVKESDLKGRRDLRKDLIITIDGIDAKDLDDAVRVLKLPNKNYLLGVYIADVSYYVTLNSPIDLEARERGTSLYVVDRVIPMLPHKLSNGICSLNPGEDRLVIACEMEINNQGKVVDYEIFPGVINSKYRMNYSDVNKILEENNKKLQEKYNEIVPMLKDMEALAKILKENRIKRGAIDFLSDEAVITVDEKGLPINIEPRIQRTGEKIIEEFMIRANETVTEHFHWLDVPFIYRIHETPKEKKIEHFLNFVKLTGHKLPKKINLTNPKSLQEVLTSLETSEIYPVFSELLLRAMQKACYSEKNVGHFGLASKYYTHFTAPIRRYPDLIVHRLIRDYIFNGEAKTDWDKLIPPIAEHASIQEREAIECEREVEDMKKAEYMKSHVGEVFEGIISGVTSFGFFARLPNTIEGLVHILDLNDDYYYFDEKTLSLIGEKKKKRYRIGDKVKVKVINASKIDLTIDFTVV